MPRISVNQIRSHLHLRSRFLFAPIPIALLSITLSINALAATSINDSYTHSILKNIWQYDFATASDSSKKLIADEATNPVGYFLMGLVNYSISNQYRSDNNVDSITFYLDRAIELSQIAIEASGPSSEQYFVLGSSFGCRALFRSIHGGWWGAFRDGHHSCSNLEKAFALDSNLTDALSGIGAYHYWKSAKSKKFAFLPFISDQRKVGIAEIYRAIDGDGIMVPNARKALLPIYNFEKRFEETLILADSLARDGFFDSNSQLHVIRALIEMARWGDADSALNEVQIAWSNSTYADSCGSTELLFLRAQVRIGQGRIDEAKNLVEEIKAADKNCGKNEYFRDTLGKARALSFK